MATDSGGSHASRITVLMPVRNAGPWIEESLRSVLAQTRHPDELLIVDDGSTDESMDVVDRLWQPWFRVIKGPQSGLAAALRLGIEESEGDLVARLDADDVASRDRLRLQEEAFADNQLTICGGWSTYLPHRPGRAHFKPPVAPSTIARFCGLGNPFVHSTVMLRRDVVVAAGNYRAPTSGPYPEDYDLWLRMLERGRGRNLAHSLVAYRVHASSVSARHSRELGLAAAALAESAFPRIIGGEALSASDAAVIRAYHGVCGPRDRYSVVDVQRFLHRLSTTGTRWPPGAGVPWPTRARLTVSAITAGRRARAADEESR